MQNHESSNGLGKIGPNLHLYIRRDHSVTRLAIYIHLLICVLLYNL